MIPFYKYHGAGNDFIIIDDRTHDFDTADVELVSKMCDRHFGIGADGLMLLRQHESLDFEMIYFNADGNPSSMCGNGGRCLVSFAKKLGVIECECRFMAVDGEHKAVVHSEKDVSLEMIDVSKIDVINERAVLMDTGSPHYVLLSQSIDDLDLVKEARVIRYSERFRDEGVNVNFIEQHADGIKIRTYERGVEDETLACGTGVTAAAIAAHQWGLLEAPISVQAVGGPLNVSFNESAGSYSNVWKRGPVELVFEGKYINEG